VVAGESAAIIVQVAEESPPIREPVSPPDDEPLKPELLWEAMIALTTVALAAAIYIRHRRKIRAGRSATVRSFVAIAHQDLGEQTIAADGDGKVAGNLHFVVAMDHGVQEIDPACGLVASEDDFTGGERDGT
jgi:hypothetical protein